jgi:hypothetical protein
MTGEEYTAQKVIREILKNPVVFDIQELVE